MKYLFLILCIVGLSVACKRRPGQVPTHGNIEWKEPVLSASTAATPEISDSENIEEKVVVSVPVKKKVSKVFKVPALIKAKPAEAAQQVEITTPAKPADSKKEIPTALSNAMWITFIGLGGALLMVLLLPFFDTSVLIVLFGIVFVIGVVSWIMFKMRAKPKVQ